jgi:hypothetical protein
LCLAKQLLRRRSGAIEVAKPEPVQLLVPLDDDAPGSPWLFTLASIASSAAHHPPNYEKCSPCSAEFSVRSRAVEQKAHWKDYTLYFCMK